MDHVRTRPRLSVAFGAACMILLAACASTAGSHSVATPHESSGGAMDSDGSASSAGRAGSTDAVDANDQRPPGGTGASVGQEDGSGTTPPGGTGSSPGGGTADADGSGATGGTTTSPAGEIQGIDDASVRVGLAIYEDADTYVQGLGVEGATLGDQSGNYRAMTDWFNEQGGVWGREISPVFYHWQTSGEFASQEQAACAKFTEDEPVFMSLAGGILHSDGPFPQCMNNAGTPVLSSSHYTGFVGQNFSDWPLFAETNTVTYDAIARHWPQVLDSTGYFEPRSELAPTRIGLVAADWERVRRVVEEELKPALAALGHEIEVEVYVHRPNHLSETSRMAAASQSAVLQLQSAGVEHVLLFDGGRLLPLVFMTTAENQEYRPRYGLITPNGQFQVGSVPESQFREARLMGWSPLIDVPASENDVPADEAQVQCDRIYQEAGIAFANTNARLVGYIACEQFRALKAIETATGGNLVTQRAAMQTWLSLGSSYTSPIVGPTQFGTNRHFGVSRFRPAQFFDDCDCFRYSGGWQALG